MMHRGDESMRTNAGLEAREHLGPADEARLREVALAWRERTFWAYLLEANRDPGDHQEPDLSSLNAFAVARRFLRGEAAVSDVLEAEAVAEAAEAEAEKTHDNIATYPRHYSTKWRDISRARALLCAATVAVRALRACLYRDPYRAIGEATEAAMGLARASALRDAYNLPRAESPAHAWRAQDAATDLAAAAVRERVRIDAHS